MQFVFKLLNRKSDNGNERSEVKMQTNLRIDNTRVRERMLDNTVHEMCLTSPVVVCSVIFFFLFFDF